PGIVQVGDREGGRDGAVLQHLQARPARRLWTPAAKSGFSGPWEPGLERGKPHGDFSCYEAVCGEMTKETCPGAQTERRGGGGVRGRGGVSRSSCLAGR